MGGGQIGGVSTLVHTGHKGSTASLGETLGFFRSPGAIGNWNSANCFWLAVKCFPNFWDLFFGQLIVKNKYFANCFRPIFRVCMPKRGCRFEGPEVLKFYYAHHCGEPWLLGSSFLPRWVGYWSCKWHIRDRGAAVLPYVLSFCADHQSTCTAVALGQQCLLNFAVLAIEIVVFLDLFANKTSQG